MRFGLQQASIGAIQKCLALNKHIDEAIIYGSRAKGNYRPGSDIDLTLKGENLTFSDLARLENEIDELLLPYKFDISIYHQIDNPDLIDHIKRVGVLFYKRSRSMSEWREIELGEVAEVQTGPFGSQLKNEQYITGGTPVVTVEHIQNFRIVDFDYPSITDEDKERLSKYLMKEGDILFTRVGSVDLSAYVSKGQDGWMFSSRMLRVRPNEEINSRFLSYYFQQKSFRDFILNISVGATMPSINTGILKTIPISYPPIEKQCAIASILSSLDNKIDLLHRQNRTLEQMAETLFRQWFVEEADEDWEWHQLDEFVEVHRGLSYKGAGLTDAENGIPMHNLNSVFEGGGYKESGIKYYNGEFKERHKVFSGDVIVTNTEQGHEHLLIGYPAIVPSNFGDYGIFSQHIYRLEIKSKLSNFFLFHLLKTQDVHEQIAGATNGSTVNMLSKDGVEWVKFRMPPQKMIDDFTQIVNDHFKKQELNQTQIRTLTALRDTLLPKLMSGEVTIADVRRQDFVSQT